MNRSRSLGPWVLILAAAIMSPRAHGAQSEYEQLNAAYTRAQQLWEQGHKLDAVRELRSARNLPGWSTPQMQLVLGVCECQIGSERADGYNRLLQLRYKQANDSALQQQLEGELLRCKKPAEARTFTPGQVLKIDRPGTQESRVEIIFSGKEYTPDSQLVARTQAPTAAVRRLPPEQLARRWVPLDDPARAIAQVKADVPGGQAVASEHFVLISPVHDRKQLERIAATLETYLAFLVRQYRISAPESFATVYLLPNEQELSEFARRLHGLELNPQTVGYSFPDALSVAGTIPGDAAGTLLHEVFHLIIGDRYGEIPDWLNEGMASLYEESGIQDGAFYGKPNWRGRVLQQLWCERPSLRALVRNEVQPSEQYATEEARKRAVARSALARYFVLYLQERGALTSVYKAFSGMSPEQVRGDPAAHAEAMVERALGGKDIKAIQDDFEDWFRRISASSESPDDLFNTHCVASDERH